MGYRGQAERLDCMKMLAGMHAAQEAESEARSEGVSQALGCGTTCKA